MIANLPKKRRSDNKVAKIKKLTDHPNAQKLQIKTSESGSSSLNRRREELCKQVQQESLVDNEKVRIIKNAIANGTYQVNPETIAEKLMEIEFQTSEKGKG